MKIIPLTRGKSAKVDDEDYERVSKFKWFAYKGKKDRVWYARRNEWASHGKQRTVSLHRFIMNAPKGTLVDHKDVDGLNCQKSNMRLCNISQNCCNKKISRVNKTGYKGVSKIKDIRMKKKYRAGIKINQKVIYLGVFETPEQAAMAYNEAAKKYHGEFARLNIIKPSE